MPWISHCLRYKCLLIIADQALWSNIYNMHELLKLKYAAALSVDWFSLYILVRAKEAFISL